MVETSICLTALFEDLACVNQGLGKSLLIIWFQEIVNSVHFECTNGVRIVSRTKIYTGARPLDGSTFSMTPRPSRSGISTSRKTMSG